MRKRVAVLLLLLLVATAAGVRAMSVLPPVEVVEVSFCWAEVPFKELMSAAELIVIGTVTGLDGPIWSGPLDASGERAITTPVRLLVEETLKGDVPVGEEVRFRQFGGRIGRTMMWFSDSVQFLTGERVLVALYRSDGEVGLMVDGGLHASRCKYVIARDGAVKQSPEPEIATLDQLRSRVLSAIGQ